MPDLVWSSLDGLIRFLACRIKCMSGLVQPDPVCGLSDTWPVQLRVRQRRCVDNVSVGGPWPASRVSVGLYGRVVFVEAVLARYLWCVFVWVSVVRCRWWIGLCGWIGAESVGTGTLVSAKMGSIWCGCVCTVGA